MTIFPNPGNAVFTGVGELFNDNLVATVYYLVGKVVMTTEATPSENQLDLTVYPSGMQRAVACSKEKQYFKKLIKD